MSPKIEYPKPLPELINENNPIETGFTLTEIVALQNGWRLMKRRLQHHSAKIFIDFFTKNFFLLESFRNAQTEKFYLTSLHQHNDKMMAIYGRLIESGLNDVNYVNMILSEVVSQHKVCGVKYDSIKLITQFVKDYLIEFLDKIKSATFVNALEKLSEIISEHHREKAEIDDNSSKEEIDL